MIVTSFQNARDDDPLSMAVGVRYYSLARHALVAGLRALGVGVGGHVLMPEYICRDLLAAVHEVGASASFYAVDKCLQPATEPADWPRADVVVAVNYFGFEQPLAPFRHYCAMRGARLIEDNAHGFLSRDIYGQWLGLRGEVGLFSLRKTFPMINGAALVVQANDVAAMLAPQKRATNALLPFSLRMRRTLRYATGSRKPELVVAQGIRWLRKRFIGHSIVPTAIDAEMHIPGYPEPAGDLFVTLALQKFAVESERRRRLYDDILICAKASSCQPVFPYLPEGIVPYGFPAFCDDPYTLRAISRGFGLDCFRWPDLPDALAQHAPEHYRRLYVANFL